MAVRRFVKHCFGIRFLISLVLCAALVGLTLFAFPSPSRARFQRNQSVASKKRQRPPFVPGEVLVRYRDEVRAADAAKSSAQIMIDGVATQVRFERLGGRASDMLPGLRIARVAPEQTLETVEALRRQPDVLYAEPNYILRAAAVPNDTRYDLHQWNLRTIGAEQAWDTIKGSRNAAASGFTTPQVVIGVIDQGIDINHQDLQPNVWTNPNETANGVDDDGNGCVDDINGCNFIPLTTNNGTVFTGADAETHATHVAGIAGAAGNNGTGISGVNWSVGLMSLKFLDSVGNGSTSTAIEAVIYATEMREKWNDNPATGANIRVLNASFGGGGFSQAFEEALSEANDAGILFVAAAGNIDFGTSIPDNDLVPHFPSSFTLPNIVAVASTNQDDVLDMSFSHFGATSVDLAAPGVDILSTTPECTVSDPLICDPLFTEANGDSYSVFTGTSMSVPHVSGAAALLWALNPNLSVQQVKRTLMFSGDVKSTLVDKTLSGRRLNIGQSVNTILQGDMSAPNAVSNFKIDFQVERKVNLSWTAASDNGTSGVGLYQLSFVDGSSGAVIPLKGVIPATAGSLQTTQVSIPYRHTSGTIRLDPFDKAGNQGPTRTASVTIPSLIGDPYTTSVGQAALISGPQENTGLIGDDFYVDYEFPTGFTFPFFGSTPHSSLIISTNGALYFSAPPERVPPPDAGPADDVPSSPKALGGFQMIAGLWDDLIVDTGGGPTGRSDAGVFVLRPAANRLVFRWRAKPCNFNGEICEGSPNGLNFEIELRTDGTIKTRYGSGNADIFPTVGIGGGAQDGYVITSHSSDETQISLNNAAEVTFTPRAPWSPTAISSTQAEMKAWTFEGRSYAYVKLNFPDAGFRVADWGAAVRAGNTFTANAIIERFNGASALANTTTAQIWDLGPLTAGNYTFTFRNSGTTVKSLNFSVGGATTPNPIDEAREFVRWQYKDFLRREPDGPGWDHWTGEITECSNVAKRFPGESEPQCIERKRANTSAAFFLSPEFQNTGYFVLRVYRGSLGRMPHFGGSNPADPLKDEFTRDAGTVSQGIVVNDKLAPAVINANKQAFVNEFVTRAEFRAIYDGLNNTEYVDRLFQTTGVTPTTAERNALITEASTAAGRASVLFKVVDGTTTITDGHLVFNTTYGKAFYDNLFNAAFVQMEYFGYLLRDPDDGGYAFWLGKLNQFGNWVDAQMVLAFIKSPEYRSRFGAP